MSLALNRHMALELDVRLLPDYRTFHFSFLQLQCRPWIIFGTSLVSRFRYYRNLATAVDYAGQIYRSYLYRNYRVYVFSLGTNFLFGKNVPYVLVIEEE